MSCRFACTPASAGRQLDHVWETMVGSGHATLALRADWQRQLARCRRELGVRYVRCHGILSDDVGTLMCENDQLVYSFFNADSIYDFLVSIGMKPVVELSFMPSTLSSGDDTVFHYRGNITPPKDLAQWVTLIDKLVRHWVERYGLVEVRTWMFEVWNEPNLPAFWTGTQDQYFALYAATARTIKAIDPELRVGGPATADNAWVPEFLAYCRKHHASVDFVSTHHYPTDAFGKPGDDTEHQLAASHRSVLRDEASQVHGEAGDHPLYYTEWSTSSNPFDDRHDEPYAAAFIVKSVLEVSGIVEGYSYWTFSDIFEENYFSSQPFHGGFGLLTIHGIAKPAYRAYELLHRLGDELLEVTGTHSTVDVWVTRSARTLAILVANGALPDHAIATELVTIALPGLVEIRTAFVERIDANHANPRRTWEAMGRPQHLLPRDVAALEAMSVLVAEPLRPRVAASGLELELAMPPQSVALVMVEL
ncbi:MAG: glycosyl hydrolase [Deltaproteobacteria bacterium]